MIAIYVLILITIIIYYLLKDNNNLPQKLLEDKNICLPYKSICINNINNYKFFTVNEKINNWGIKTNDVILVNTKSIISNLDVGKIVLLNETKLEQFVIKGNPKDYEKFCEKLKIKKELIKDKILNFIDNNEVIISVNPNNEYSVYNINDLTGTVDYIIPEIFIN